MINELFLEACLNQNSLSELREVLQETEADATDLKNWQITASTWRDTILAAIKIFEEENQ